MEPREIIRLLAGENPKLQLYALQEWEKHHSQDPEPLFAALDATSPELVGKALELAARYHPSSCSVKVIRLLNGSDSRIRRLAVEHLAPAMGQAAQDALIALLKTEKDPFVLASAVTTGARLRLLPGHLKPFLTHPEVRLRANTIRALGALGSPDIRPLVEPALKDPSLRVQGEALVALAPLIAPTDLEAHILRRLENPDPMVRAATIIITAQLPLPNRLAMIVERLQDQELRVVHCALRGLAILNDPSANRQLIERYLSEENIETRHLLLKSLARIPAESLQNFLARVGSPTHIDQESFSRILDLVLAVENREPFLPWVITSVERSEGSLRRKGLEVVLLQLEFFRPNFNPLLARAEREGGPREKALAARIRMRAGEIAGGQQLRALLFSQDPTERQAAAEELKKENNLLARGALEEARRAGVTEAFVDGARPEFHPGQAPVALPDLLPLNPSEPHQPGAHGTLVNPLLPPQAPSDPAHKNMAPSRPKKGSR